MASRIQIGNGSAPSLTLPWSVSGIVALGDVVYQVSGADRTVARADASDSAKRPAIGVVTGLAGSTVLIACNGEIAANMSGLVAGTVYYLGTTPGQMVATKPASNAYLVGVAISSTEILVSLTDVDVTQAGGASGAGTATSVAVTSGDGRITVTGSPVTTSGTVNLALNSSFSLAQGGTNATTRENAWLNLTYYTNPGISVYSSSTGITQQSTGSLANQYNGMKADSAQTSGLTMTFIPRYTSYGITTSDPYLTISNSPVTTSGVITLDINAVLPASKGGTGLTSTSATSVIFTKGSTVASQPIPLYMRNRIINGAMNINQYTSNPAVLDGTKLSDRWYGWNQSSALLYADRILAAGAVADYTNIQRFTLITPGSATSNQYVGFDQKIEANNIVDFQMCQAGAKTVTVSFTVLSTVAGSYAFRLYNPQGNQSYVEAYNIPSPNVYMRVNATIPLPTSGTWTASSAAGLQLWFDLGSGSDFEAPSTGTWLSGNYTTASFVTGFISGSNGATFSITGVQLELGELETPFEFLPTEIELAAVQRYCTVFSNPSNNDVAVAHGNLPTSTTGKFVLIYPQFMRAAPAISFSGGGSFLVTSADSAGNAISTPAIFASYTATTSTALLDVERAAGSGVFSSALLRFSQAAPGGIIVLNAEI